MSALIFRHPKLLARKLSDTVLTVDLLTPHFERTKMSDKVTGRDCYLNVPV